MMNIIRQSTWIHKNEFLESIVVDKGGKIRFYSHTYFVRTKGRKWIPYVKWDNWDRQPHVDKYDGSGVLVEQGSCMRRAWKKF